MRRHEFILDSDHIGRMTEDGTIEALGALAVQMTIDNVKLALREALTSNELAELGEEFCTQEDH